MFLAGTILGGIGSALAAGSWRIETVPRVWAERFGPSPARRYVVAFIGWVFLAVMFATGTITAFIMFRPKSP